MSYLVLARKWRPKTFEQVVGQQHVLRALINGLDQNRLHHAFLFSGTRGVGKTTLARIFAKSLNCEQGVSSQPCGECQSCVEVDSGRFVDLIEVDAASRTKVDDTRELLDNVQYAPSRGRYKVYLIDEVHMLSTSSFNALLKTLEEPPPHVKFLFATTDPQKLPVTILSRCLQFNLRRLDLTQISEHLSYILGEEQLAFEQTALIQLARAADGSMRDALSLLDQAIAFGAGNVTSDVVFQMLGSIDQDQINQLLSALQQQDAKGLLQQSAELAALGRDFEVILNAILDGLQKIATHQLIPDLAAEEYESTNLKELANTFDAETVQLLYQIALHGKRDLPWAADPKSGFEMTLLRMLSFQPRGGDGGTESLPIKKSDTLRKPAVDVPPVTANNVSNTDSKNIERPATSSVVSTEQTLSDTNTTITETLSASDTQLASAAKEQQAAAINPISNTQAPTEELTATEVDEPIPEVNEDTLISVDLSPANWTQIISELKLSALTRQLAENSAFIRCEQRTLQLALSSELAHLATAKSKERLEQALQKKLDQDVSVVFNHNTDSAQSGPTVAVERAEQLAFKQQQAIESIQNDPTIELIKNTFNARIIESTIKPID
ncbi:DNA polymerase III subunit gamma/tau [Methylophaga sulfidovorans]|uniref:DNA polymerase III subunit gamma/tau n=1 Tax=Methylophaga sulfidovorans TaxID=45496 RepID=A0A1I3V298_9GAMM|nr:DNA polymerase III subunit gamma/tau [Methylophaga sulfidovorans]SFJ88261.1 DNA polymerase-3 subunit gamma/tau [Methylophaga sulfidovorans]